LAYNLFLDVIFSIIFKLFKDLKVNAKALLDHIDNENIDNENIDNEKTNMKFFE